MSAGERGAVSQERPRLKVCEACGAAFSCSAPDGPCWCDSVKLDSAVLAELRANFTDCLCPECLTSRAKENSPS